MLRRGQGRQERLRLDRQQFLRRNLKVNADPKAWIYVAEGYCDRIVNASKTPE